MVAVTHKARIVPSPRLRNRLFHYCWSSFSSEVCLFNNFDKLITQKFAMKNIFKSSFSYMSNCLTRPNAASLPVLDFFKLMEMRSLFKNSRFHSLKSFATFLLQLQAYLSLKCRRFSEIVLQNESFVKN